MKLQQQVTTLKLAKELKEAGVEMETAFKWVEDGEYGRNKVKDSKVVSPIGMDSGCRWDNEVFAPTATELLEVLPYWIYLNVKDKLAGSLEFGRTCQLDLIEQEEEELDELTIRDDSYEFHAMYRSYSPDRYYFEVTQENKLADALAKLYLKLKEEDML